jgi:hypothetical protein
MCITNAIGYDSKLDDEEKKGTDWVSNLPITE